MINISDITSKLEEQLKNNSAMVQEGLTRIYRSEYVNYSPDLASNGWVGIYKEDSTSGSASLGKHSRSWKDTINFNLLIQASHLGSGAECEDKLDKYIKLVKDAIWADPKISDTVDMITGFRIDYSYEMTESDSIFFQWAELKFTCEVSTG